MFKNLALIVFLLLSLNLFAQDPVYILEFENPSQNATHLTWDVRIRASAAPFGLVAGNIRYNFNNVNSLSTTDLPEFTVTHPNFAFDTRGFLGTAPNRYVNLAFSNPANVNVTVDGIGIVLGTVSHPRALNSINGTPTDTRIRVWNIPSYTNYAPAASAINCTRLFTKVGDNAVLVQADLPGNLVNILLPVKLKTFSAEKVGERSAKLDWVSATEVNVSHYEIERSVDALSFEYIGKVNAVGNSVSESRYDFLDKKVPASRTNIIVYYRLKMVDLDGSFEYSDVRGLNFSNNVLTNVSMYPNPTAQMLNIDVNLPDFTEGNANLQILDATGKLVLDKKVTGNGIESVDMSRYSNGVYHVILKQDYTIFNEKVIKVE